MDTRLMSAVDVAEALGLTYRQIDYLSREVLDYKPSSGVRRTFDRDTFARLAVAVALTNVTPQASPTAHSPLRSILQSVLAGPAPPRQGWVLLDAGDVFYVDDPDDVFIFELSAGGVIARYEVP